MSKMELKLKYIENYTYICSLKISYSDSKRYIKPFVFSIDVIKNGQKFNFSREIKCNKIIVPEIFNYYANGDVVQGIYTNIGTLKFKVNNVAVGDIIRVVCKYENEEIDQLQYIINDFKENVYHSKNNTEFIIHTNSLEVLEKSYDIVAKMVKRLPAILDMSWEGKIYYYIVDDVECLYDFVEKIDILNSYNMSYQDKIICCVFNKANMEKILIHETVHVILYKKYGFMMNSMLRMQNLFIEGFCQYIMNIYTRRQSCYKRYVVSLKYLLFFLDDIENYLNLSDENKLKYVDIIFSYEFIPYILLFWGSNESILRTIIDLPNNLFEVCEKIKKIVKKIDIKNENMRLIMEDTSTLYQEAYDILYNMSQPTCLDSILEFREKIENLYFGDY